MFRNNLKLILRKLRREKLYTLVNILGLTIGLTAFLLIALYVRDELSFDRFHHKVDEIYRIASHRDTDGTRGATVPVDFVELVAQDAPEIESFVRIKEEGLTNLISTKESAFYTDKLIFTDPVFFSFFDFNLIDGRADLVLSSPQSVVLTKSFALKLFGRLDVAGEELIFNKEDKYQVAGICEDVPKNSSIQFELVALADEDLFKDKFSQSYLTSALSFVRVSKVSDIENLESKINDEIRQKTSYFKVKQNDYYQLDPFTEARLHSNYDRDKLNTSNAEMVYLFSGIGSVILLLAIINYINLVTAQSIKRVKETGLRKVIGAGRTQLVAYHLMESLVVTVISFICSFAIAERLIPSFNSLLNKGVSLDYASADFLIWTLVIGFAIGVLSGVYPAFYITRVSPLALLNKSTVSVGGRGLFRKLLVLFQFTVSAVLIIVLSIMSSQMLYLNKTHLGFEKDNLISIPLYEEDMSLSTELKSQMLKQSGVMGVSLNDWEFGGVSSTGSYNKPAVKGEVPEPKSVWHDMVNADPDFFDVMGVKVLYQSEAFAKGEFRKNQVVVNKTFLQAFDWPENSVGTKIYQFKNEIKEIVAVVDNFYTYSMKEDQVPLLMEGTKPWSDGNLLVRVDFKEREKTLNTIGDIYQSATNRPFEYYFIDDKIASYYKEEQGHFQIFQGFSFLALFISLLGLTALTIYMVEHRRKEVSIRKVLGASLQRLVFMLNKEFTILIVISFVIALPLAYYAMQDWLAEFKNRVTISPLLFILTFIGFLVISWIVTVIPSFKASQQNPADVLRDE